MEMVTKKETMTLSPVGETTVILCMFSERIYDLSDPNCPLTFHNVKIDFEKKFSVLKSRDELLGVP